MNKAKIAIAGRPRETNRGRNSPHGAGTGSTAPKIGPRFDAVRGVEKEKSSEICPIVGVGGSAGGFEAAMEFLRHLPSKTGMAFVIVQHLDPHHASRLSSLLGKVTAMPVIEVAGTTKPEPNKVYVQPSNKCVIAKNGALTLVRREERLKKPKRASRRENEVMWANQIMPIHRFRRFTQICYEARS